MSGTTRTVPWARIALLEFITIIAVVNGFLIAGFIAKIQPPDDPRVLVDNIGYEVGSTSDIGDGMAWFNYQDYMLQPTLFSELANDGNMYAPDILIEDGLFRMYYGAQGRDGKDRIHYATSTDGLHWQKYGVIVDPGDEVHANDPSVVKVNGTYYMLYTVATVAEWDKIFLATSPDGVNNWSVQGLVFDRSDSGWDSFIVGRPSVLHENGTFKMWYDGMERDAENPTKVKPGTGRHVGYATSPDAITWTRYAGNPIFLNSGAIDVEHFDGKYVVVEESGAGVLWRWSTNETAFPGAASWLFQKQNTTFDLYGHVTPFILLKDGKWVATYTGAATRQSWDGNRIDAWFPVYNVSVLADTGTTTTGNHVFTRGACNLVSPSTMAAVFDRNLLGNSVHVTYYNGINKENEQQSILPENNTIFIFNKFSKEFTVF